MSGTDGARHALDAWIDRVRTGLKGLPPEEIDDIVRELSSHALERAGGAGADAASMAGALNALGQPRELAGLYLGERIALRVERNRSPWQVMRAVWRLAGISVDAAFVLAGSLAGYALALVFLLTALAKPFWPHRVGLWRLPTPDGDLSVSIGRTLHPVGQELVGWWIVPLGLLLGSALAFLTWRFGLAGVRRLGRARTELNTPKG
jgi:hypothetical protein